jgi:FKBP-type peptidyl-prolyl cis-trans isomerase FkpA/FKBP-type peptidyl-prolyl cis-trans isomerase FklB
MRTSLGVLTLALTTLAACGGGGGETRANLDSEEGKTLYAVGLAISQNIASLKLTEQELANVEAGLRDGVLAREPKVKLDEYRPKVQQLAQTRAQAATADEKKAGASFVEKAAQEPGATKTASGIVITQMKEGAGETPKATDRVKVHYHGTLTDGTVFDSSVERGEPATFPLNGVIPCWTEGVQQIKVGGKAKLVCPAELAYGDRGSPPKIKPGSTLVFEVELLEIVK